LRLHLTEVGLLFGVQLLLAGLVLRSDGVEHVLHPRNRALVAVECRFDVGLRPLLDFVVGLGAGPVGGVLAITAALFEVAAEHLPLTAELVDPPGDGVQIAVGPLHDIGDLTGTPADDGVQHAFAVLPRRHRRRRVVHPLPHRIEVLAPGADHLCRAVDLGAQPLIQLGRLPEHPRLLVIRSGIRVRRCAGPPRVRFG
jgi:hypothetical protein